MGAAKKRRALTRNYEAGMDVEFTPKGRAQTEAFETYKNNSIVFFLGPAGVGKTHLAVACALHDVFARVRASKERYHRIILSRPIVEAGENLGFLPGEIAEKVHPYMAPVYTCLEKLIKLPEKAIEDFVDIIPLAYMQGHTFEGSVAILDEAQNCTSEQLKLFVSRLGDDSKLIIAGDPTQSYIGRKSALADVVEALTGIDGVGVHMFSESDIVRHPLVARVLKRWPDKRC